MVSVDAPEREKKKGSKERARRRGARRNWRCTLPVPAAFGEKFRWPGGAIREEKERGESRRGWAFMVGFSCSRG
jgi:hypothetical protein